MSGLFMAVILRGTWTLSACLASPPLFGWGRYGYLRGQSFCFADWPTSISYTFFMVGMSTLISSPTKSPDVKAPSDGNVDGAQNTDKFDSTTQTHQEHTKNKTDDTYVEDLTTEENSVNDENAEQNQAEKLTLHDGTVTESSDQSAQQNRAQTLTLHDNTVTESSPDNMLDVADPKDGSGNTDHAAVNGNIQRKIKKSIAHDSTVRKSYRAGIINSVGSNSSLDKDIQQQIAIESMGTGLMPDSDIAKAVKRKLSFGTSSSKSKVSTGKKAFGNFLTIPGKKPLQAGDLAERRRREKEKRMRAEELRLTTSLFVVILVFVFCWLPFCCTMFWSVFTEDSHAVPRPIDMATLLLGCGNSMCNPIIYGVMNKRFKKGFQRLFCYFRNRLLRELEKTDGSLQMNSTLSSKTRSSCGGSRNSHDGGANPVGLAGVPAKPYPPQNVSQQTITIPKL